jgi:hypothetical protein
MLCLVAMAATGCARPGLGEDSGGGDGAGPGPMVRDLATPRDLAGIDWYGVDLTSVDLATPGKQDLASGNMCPGKNLATDPMNCGQCGKVCMGARVAMSTCMNGRCAIGMCVQGFHDVNGNYDDGCECTAEASERTSSSQCEGAASVATVTDGKPSMVTIEGNLVPMGDEDWYQVNSVDDPGLVGGCNNYKLKIQFAENPGKQFRFDVKADDCVKELSCAGMGEKPTGLTEYTWSANDGPNGGNECPCVPAAKPPKGFHQCADHSQTLRLRVYRLPGMPATCDSYKIVVINGM